MFLGEWLQELRGLSAIDTTVDPVVPLFMLWRHERHELSPRIWDQCVGYVWFVRPAE